MALLPLASPAHLVMAPGDWEDDQDCLPLRLLTPAQAERDEKTRDVYHFLTVQADVAVPRRHLRWAGSWLLLRCCCAGVVLLAGMSMHLAGGWCRESMACS